FERDGSAGAAMKRPTEIVERLRALALLPDNGVDFQPDKGTLRVIVHAAAQVAVVAARLVQHLRGDGGTFERTPGASELVVEIGGRIGERFPIVFGAPQTAARCKDLAQVIGQAFVHPEQVALHRRVVAAVLSTGKQASRTPVLAIPRMRKLV